jgi:hypothetical protein
MRRILARDFGADLDFGAVRGFDAAGDFLCFTMPPPPPGGGLR